MGSKELIQRKDDLQHDIETQKYQIKTAMREVRDTTREAAGVPARAIRRQPALWMAGALAVGVTLGLLRAVQRRRSVKRELKSVQAAQPSWRPRFPRVLIVRAPARALEPAPRSRRWLGIRSTAR